MVSCICRIVVLALLSSSSSSLRGVEAAHAPSQAARTSYWAKAWHSDTEPFEAAKSGDLAQWQMSSPPTAVLERFCTGTLGTLRTISQRFGGWFDYNSFLQKATLPRLAAVALMAWMAVLCWMLATTAESFFCPPLEYWVRKLNLKAEVAGATLLAFGNGAPDVFTAQAAASVSDIPLVLGEVLGANCFLLCVVMGALILAGQDKEGAVPDKVRFSYSVLWYMFCVLAIFLIIADGTVSVNEASFLLTSYCVYVVSLIVWNAFALKTSKAMDPCIHVEASTVVVPLAGLQPPSKDGSIFEWIYFVLAWPLFAIRWLTIPPSDDLWDTQRRIFCSLSPVGMLVFSACLFWHSASLVAWIVMGAVAFFIGIGFYLMSDSGASPPVWYPLVTLIAKVSSCLWLALLAVELTQAARALGAAIGIPSALLGIGLVSWGNSIGDLLAGLALTRTGNGRMAIVAVFSGPLFNNLIGFGLALLSYARAHGGQAVIWSAGDQASRKAVMLPLVAGFCVTMAAPVIVMLAYRQTGFSQVPRPLLACLLWGLYGAFWLTQCYALRS